MGTNNSKIGATSWRGWATTATTLIASFILTQHPAAAQERTAMGLHVAIASMPLTISGMRDVHVSDHEFFYAQEGRIELPLSRGNTTNPFLPGVKIALSARMPDYVDFALELGAYPGDVSAFMFMGGVDLYLIGTDWIRLGGMVRAGWMLGSMYLGTAHVLPGFVDPVETAFGTIYNGDRLQAQMTGPAFSAGGVFEVDITPMVTFRLEGQFQAAIMGDLELQAGPSANPVTIDGYSRAVLLANPTSRSLAYIDPSGESLGFTGSVGIVYSWE